MKAAALLDRYQMNQTINFKNDGRLKLLIIIGTRSEALVKACFMRAGISERGLLQAVDSAVALPTSPIPTTW